MYIYICTYICMYIYRVYLDYIIDADIHFVNMWWLV
jgi:hypothetical protein